MKHLPYRGFSLVEIAVALAVVAFGLLTVIALLPLGVQSNKISAEETRAAMILTMLEMDLRNSYPSSVPEDSRSRIFGLKLPYQLGPSGRYEFNSTISAALASKVDATTTTRLDDGDRPISMASSSKPRFQVSVVYLQPPTPNAVMDLPARLIVTWPVLPEGSISVPDLTNASKVSGFLDTFVSFPAP